MTIYPASMDTGNAIKDAVYGSISPHDVEGHRSLRIFPVDLKTSVDIKIEDIYAATVSGCELKIETCQRLTSLTSKYSKDDKNVRSRCLSSSNPPDCPEPIPAGL
jgi:hypothetical protein